MSVRSFERRLGRLEGEGRRTGGACPIAVLESPFPSGDEREWALDLRAWVATPAALVVTEGPERKLLLPPTDARDDAAMPHGSDAERLWMIAESTYPSFHIFGTEEGELLVCHWHSEEDRRRDERELRELAKGRPSV